MIYVLQICLISSYIDGPILPSTAPWNGLWTLKMHLLIYCCGGGKVGEKSGWQAASRLATNDLVSWYSQLYIVSRWVGLDLLTSNKIGHEWWAINSGLSYKNTVASILDPCSPLLIGEKVSCQVLPGWLTPEMFLLLALEVLYKEQLVTWEDAHASKFCCKDPYGKYFRLFRLPSLCHSVLTGYRIVLARYGKTHRQ